MKDEGEENGYQRRWFDREGKGKFNEAIRGAKRKTRTRRKQKGYKRRKWLEINPEWLTHVVFN